MEDMPEIDVLAGIIGSDGHLEKNQAVIRIINKDLNFLEKTVKPILNSLGISSKPKFRSSGFGSGKFVVAFTSQELWKLMQEKFNIPTGKKSEKIEPPTLTTNQEKVDFLRGWIAGDGSVTTDRGRPKIEIWSKSEKVLKWFKKILKENHIKSKFWSVGETGKFILRIGRQESIKKFHKKFTIPHPRKEERLRLLLS